MKYLQFNSYSMFAYFNYCSFVDNYHQISYHHDYDVSHETYFTLFLLNYNNVILFKFTKYREDDDDVCVRCPERTKIQL